MATKKRWERSYPHWSSLRAMRKLFISVLVVFAVTLSASPAGAAVSPGLGGCRLLIGAQIQVDTDTRSSMGGAALTKLGTVTDKKVKRILGSTANTIPRLLDWCGTKYRLSELLGV